MLFWPLYALTGAISGIMAGLLGVGGGIIIVPMLTFFFTLQQLPPEYVLHLALGTSLASIIFTSISSMRAHHGRGAVEWDIVKRISAGIVAGGLIGSAVAAQVPGKFLKAFFVVFIFYVAARLLRNVAPAPRQAPGLAGMLGAGSLIGGISSLVGIGGGTMSVPFMLRCSVPMHRAVGTSAAIGFPIALAGAVGYLVNGLRVSSLPEYSLGFIYLPALVGVALTSIITAPLGAKLAHRLPVPKLKKFFACFLFAVGAKMLWNLL